MTRLLSLCTQRKITGVLRIDSWGKTGTIRLRAGTIIEVAFGALRGEFALDELLALRDGMFELSQRLPSINDAVRDADQLLVDLDSTPLPELMRQCENKALSCAISVDRSGDPIELTYRAGELADDTAVDFEILGPSPVRVSALPFNQLPTPARPDSSPVAAPTSTKASSGASRRRSAPQSSPPPIPRALSPQPIPQPMVAPAPLPHAQHSLGRVEYPAAAADGWHHTESSAPEAAADTDATPPVAGGRAWVDPTWVNRNRSIQMDWTHTFPIPRSGVIARVPFANAALGVGLICLTLLVGVVASGL